MQVAAGEGGFADSGALWLDRMVMKALPDVADILGAVDRAIDHLFSARQLAPNDRIRELLLLTLALRHEFLDDFVYNLCNEKQEAVMRNVSLLISTDTMLRKLQGGSSFPAAWLKASKRGLLLIDELPSQSFEEVAATLPGFELVVVAGDRPQPHAGAEAAQHCREVAVGRPHRPLRTHSWTS